MDRIFDLGAEAREHVILAAHRGISGGNIPCNTLAAFSAALLQKADMIELDVGRSADGTLYVFHEGCEHPHLRSHAPLNSLKDRQIADLRYVNMDGVPTAHGVNTLDEAFELLKGRCYINIDKFASYPEQIVQAVRRHHIMAQVVVKTPAEQMCLDVLEALAPEMPYIVIIKERDEVSGIIAKRNVRFVGVEAVFTSEDSPIVSDAYMDAIHAKGLLLWGNGIVFNYKRVLSAGHSDDVAITGDPEKGWGWLARKGFDIIQTDWPLQVRTYLDQHGLYHKKHLAEERK